MTVNFCALFGRKAMEQMGPVAMLLGCVFIFAGIVLRGTEGATTPIKARPITCTDKFAAVPNHTFCLANRTQYPLTDTDRQYIVDLHNEIRSNVDPPAANMLKMYYSMTLEEEAQIWAENCVFKHEPNSQRNIPGGLSVSQNIAVSSRAGNWKRSIGLWENDKTKYNFKYGASGTVRSHYTQQIWATTTLIGCGTANCPGLGFFYVCNYGPSGNSGNISRPYIEAKSGQAGELCPSTLDVDSNSTLCDCNGTICNNRGGLDPDTCTCTCPKGPSYSDDKCTLSCAPNSDRWMCGRSPFTKSTCERYSNVPIDCPWMCGSCPYVGPNYVEGSHPLPGQPDTGRLTNTTKYLMEGNVIPFPFF